MLLSFYLGGINIGSLLFSCAIILFTGDSSSNTDENDTSVGHFSFQRHITSEVNRFTKTLPSDAEANFERLLLFELSIMTQHCFFGPLQKRHIKSKV